MGRGLILVKTFYLGTNYCLTTYINYKSLLNTKLSSYTSYITNISLSVSFLVRLDKMRFTFFY